MWDFEVVGFVAGFLLWVIGSFRNEVFGRCFFRGFSDVAEYDETGRLTDVDLLAKSWSTSEDFQFVGLTNLVVLVEWEARDRVGDTPRRRATCRATVETVVDSDVRHELIEKGTSRTHEGVAGCIL